ncbi:unnamed protein product [Clonostachys rosea]|uniref:Clr5 domain-containing protein n=1 Tax=Bionectria ochroleuca TaxID=29856 RepID=A0ABY6U5B8_BIOOC|nr:unnamed protein product [Clonostachys rosea]
MDDIFIQHRPLIQRLYQEERKTLKEVKIILERDHQFPSLPISIYETRLRNHLAVRKKFKKSDWSIIYQHHLKTKRETSSLYLNGVKYPWVKAWKEIRRSGARQTRIGRPKECLGSGPAVNTKQTKMRHSLPE